MTEQITPKALLMGADTTHPRTGAALQRLRLAMQAIEAEIELHHGVYPYNHGRVTQSELCRRADVKKATLQNPVHKDSTRVEIMHWLDGLNHRLTHTRSSTRERITALADDLTLQLQQLQQANDTAQQQLKQLDIDNALLRGSSTVPTLPGCAPLAVGVTLRHYKGGLYRVVAYCLIEASSQPGVLYRPLQGNSQHTLWLRPLAEFHDLVETADGIVRRFHPVDVSAVTSSASADTAS